MRAETRSAGGIDKADAARSEPSPVGDATTSVERLREAGEMLNAVALECSAYLPLFIGDSTPDDRRKLARAIEAYDRYRAARAAWADVTATVDSADQPNPAPGSNGPDSASGGER